MLARRGAFATMGVHLAKPGRPHIKRDILLGQFRKHADDPDSNKCATLLTLLAL
jgi:hypothetical protein